MNNAVRLSATLCLIAAACVGGQNADATLNYGSPKQTVTTSNPSNKQATTAIASYAGTNLYTGTASIRMRVPGSSVDEMQDSGTSSATLTQSDDGQMRLTVTGSFGAENEELTFFVNLAKSDLGWSNDENGMSFTIGNDGEIIGSDENSQTRMSMNGSVSAERFELEVEIEPLQAPSNIPTGTKFLYSYDLIRLAEATSSSGDSEADDNQACNNIVMKVRPVASLGGGPMIMTQVPVCAD